MAASFENRVVQDRLNESRGPEFLALAFREFFKNPLAVGSAFPASRFLVDTMLSPVDWSRLNCVVEYGPGTGIFTRALLDRLPAHARLLAIDTSAAFIDHLREATPDRRLIAVSGSADAVLDIMADHGLDEADCILSGLPFSTLSRDRGEGLMGVSVRALAPEGLFLAYQMRQAVGPLLEGRFAQVATGFEWRNLPPCHLYWASRPL
ncbi:methyltransferase domain-containing protein (plasmid) [Sphingobium sp. SJ10-10]|uniref:class I SAM-dependent methyltransferase n=1 Tax=Sphingobium sp. SJ10-10 TaxID=3114999 RepID=UPI002E17780B|nr:methyltransferase domain-containing protein [Sphingobium sp. SJ10-10]